MAIGTPALVGSLASASTSGTFAIASTTGAIATHDLVLVCHYNQTHGAEASAIADDSSNVYVPAFSTVNTGSSLQVFACYDAIAMTTGHAITATLSGSATRHLLYAVNVTGMLRVAGCLDPHVSDHVRATATSGSMAIQNSAANQMLIIGFLTGASSFGTITAGTGFTALTALTSNAGAVACYQILSSNTPITWAPSWVNNISMVGMGGGFIGVPANSVNAQTALALTGVGC